MSARARDEAGDPTPPTLARASLIRRILGPRIPDTGDADERRSFRLPLILFTVAAAMLAVSVFLPYWQLRLKAPQYPGGLVVNAYVNRLEGDVGELEGLNHYVGLAPFEEGAAFERTIAVASIITLAGLLVAGLFIHSRWVLLMTAPALLFPLLFVLDLQYWLWRYGHDLDPRAPFASAVGEFTPPVFGPAKIAQFDTLALPHIGLLLAMAASVAVGVGLWHHRKVFKPLIDEQRA